MRHTLFSFTFDTAREAIREAYRQAVQLTGAENPAFHIEEGDGGWCIYTEVPAWSYNIMTEEPVTLTILVDMDSPESYHVSGFTYP